MFTNIRNVLQGRGRILIGGLVFVLLCGIAYVMLSAHSFAKGYVVYEESASEHDAFAYQPAVQDNPLRQELNSALSQVLAGTLTSSERLEFSQRGIELLKLLEVQIDDIGTSGEEVAVAIGEMEWSAVGAKRSEIIDLARRRENIIADVRGLSYRANFHMTEIFERIIDDNGELTAEHVVELNDLIPLVEAQFNERSNLYVELESIGNRIERLYGELWLK